MAVNLINSDDITISQNGENIQLNTTVDIQTMQDGITANTNDITNLKNSKIYSTSELDTGEKWINGKPIYRMTLDYIIQTGTNTWHDIGTISNVETIVIKELFVIRENQIYLNLYNNYNFYFENNTLKEQHSSNFYEGYHLYITIEYTKAS